MTSERSRAIVAGRNVQYHQAGERAPAFTDRGNTVDIHDTRRRENVLAALQLSAQKWGTMTVTGNEQFLRTCVELAAERGFKIVNPDLQEAIAVERERQQRAKDVEQAPRDDVRRTAGQMRWLRFIAGISTTSYASSRTGVGMIPRGWTRRSR